MLVFLYFSTGGYEYATSTFPTMHLICPHPENNASAKFFFFRGGRGGWRGGWANKVHYGQSQGISVTPLFAVVLGTTVGRDAVIGQLIQETKFKVLLMFDHQSFHIRSRRLH